MDKTWDLSKIYANREEYDQDKAKALKGLDKLDGIKDDFKGNFKEILLTLIGVSERVGRLASFSNMTRDEDSRQDLGQQLALEADNLVNKYQSGTSFFRPAILQLSEEDLDELIKENDLEEYRKFLMEIFRYKDHTLSMEGEYILGSVSHMADSPQNAYYMLTNADMTFPEIESKDNMSLTSANYIALLRDPDVRVRKEAFEAYYTSYEGLDNTISSLHSDNVNNLVTEARLRNYDSARQMELYEDDVDVRVYDNLIDSVRNNLGLMHEYYRVKKEVLGLEDQHMYDVYLPLAGDLDVVIPYEEAAELIKESVKPLGDEYARVLANAFDQRWIDVYPREGKRGGAYSSGVYSSDPYILMNYNDDLESLFTLAHELGHSMHSYYSNKHNPYIYSGYTIFVAEVASTTNELLLLNYLLDRAQSDEHRVYLIDHYIDSFKSTVFRQTMFAEFEKWSHETVEKDEVLTLDAMNKKYYQLNEDYFGDAVVIDDQIKMEWMRIPHFYRNFYVYKYATGFLSAVILSRNILDAKGVEDYLNFLKDGSQNFPIDQLVAAGVDIMDPKSFESAFAVLEGLVDELKELSQA